MGERLSRGVTICISPNNRTDYIRKKQQKKKKGQDTHTQGPKKKKGARKGGWWGGGGGWGWWGGGGGGKVGGGEVTKRGSRAKEGKRSKSVCGGRDHHLSPLFLRRKEKERRRTFRVGSGFSFMARDRGRKRFHLTSSCRKGREV